MNEPTTPSGVDLAFLIEGAEDNFGENRPWRTTQRAAAEAILARYAVIPRELCEPTDPLDIEALALFRSGCGRPVTWVEFTEKQRNHWRGIARKARELHGAKPHDAEREKEVHALIGALTSADWQDATLRQLAEAAYEFGVRVVHEKDAAACT
jgi:hypothetical protein